MAAAIAVSLFSADKNTSSDHKGYKDHTYHYYRDQHYYLISF